MPGSVRNADPSTVLPAGLCSAFTEVLELPVVANDYADGTSQRAAQAETPRRRWRLTRKLTATALATLYEFWAGRRGIEAFYFYSPYEPATGAVPGSNYDLTGASMVGRHTVVFAGGWQQSTGIARTEVNFELLEVA